jgi:hypothetical protein
MKGELLPGEQYGQGRIGGECSLHGLRVAQKR